MKRDIICIGCPLGCSLEVEVQDNRVVEAKGQTCKRGEDYAIKECTNPTRIVTSSVEVIGGYEEIVSVKTRGDIPKDRIFDIIRALKGVKLEAPVSIGDIVVENVLGTGVDIIVTKSVEKKKG